MSEPMYEFATIVGNKIRELEQKNLELTAKVLALEETIDPVLANNSWALISKVGAYGCGEYFWDIGDTKGVLINGTVGTLALNDTYYAYIIDFNYRGDNGVYMQLGKTAGGVRIAFVDSHYGNASSDGSKWFNINHWGTDGSPYNTKLGGWAACDLRYDILGSTNIAPSGYGAVKTANATGYDATVAAKTSPVSNTLMAALASDLVAALSPWSVWTDNSGSTQNVEINITSTIDYLPLLSEFEVFGSSIRSNIYESKKQNQMIYYKNGNSTVAYNFSSLTQARGVFLRSPRIDSSYYFCTINSSGLIASSSTQNSSGISPAFRLAEAS